MQQKPIFNCDREWWNSLTDTEKENWLDWAVSCGADRHANLVDRNPDYPNLMCTPSVSLGSIEIEDLLDILDK